MCNAFIGGIQHELKRKMKMQLHLVPLNFGTIYTVA